ncbi:Serine protease Hip1 (Hydrolase important for pathogenesis 1) (Serine hydrolase Hip1) [Durusdinium trenchii]|uniref:Serine protease Hip1 (Hydrolase important for pathogenesis 1) (Serine hydrolase Hip1) n=1 Tax=Durusdinium trenchii TaxID=1381693 RepID=A0ABP0M9T9_9DINO
MALALLVLVWHLAWAQEPGCAEKDEQSFLQTLDILDHVEEEACDLLHPKKGLRWTHSKQIGSHTVYAGNLTVPLSPHREDQEDTPYLDLLVIMTMPTSESAASVEPLLFHCGGPGSDATCALSFMKDQQFNAYAGISISQRGIGYTAMPSFECAKEHMKLPPKGLNRSYVISDFTDCACALPDGTPLVGQAFADLDPKNQSSVHRLFENMALRARRCAADKRWVLTGATGKSYNFLDWAGTRMLAQDIEHFREKTCSPKLHLNGMSYGTAVAAVYADMFPERVGKMVINGNMPPVPFTLDFAKGQGMALTQAFGHLERLCVTWTSTPPCNLYSSEMSLSHVWAQLVSDLRAGRITAPTEIHSKGGTVNFPLSIGLVQGYVQEQMISAGFVPVGWAQPVSTLANLANLRGPAARAAEAKKILDRYCVLPSGYGTPWSGVVTWSTYGVCVGQQSVGLSSMSYSSSLGALGIPPYRKNVDGYVNGATVLGQDLFGRFTVDQAVKIWQDFSSVWDEMATSAFVGIFSEIFAWQREAVPVHAGFRQNVRALVVGNLYDPACSYTWSNRMRESLPNSVMMIWQGVGHCLGEGGDYPGSGMKPCLDRMASYWVTGELPIDGFTCRTEEPVPLLM